MSARSTIRVLCLVAVFALTAPSQAHSQSAETCIAYMEADAIYHEAVRQHDEACRAQAAKHEDNDLRVGTVLLCLFFDGPRDGKPMNEIEDERRRAYRAAYRGPISDIETVMTKLIRLDRIRCRKRFETVR